MDITLGEIINVLKKRVVTIIIAGLVCATIMAGYTTLFLTPQYTATSKLYVYNGNTNNRSFISSADLTAAKSLVDTYIVIMKSDTLMEEVASRVSGKYEGITAKHILSMFSASSINQTEAFKVSITSENPQMSMDIVNTIVECIPDEFRRVVKVGSVEIVDKAKLPTTAEWPLKRNIMLGAIVGVLVSSALFVVLSLWDRTVYDKTLLTTNFEIPIIGTIPFVEATETKEKMKERLKSGHRVVEHDRQMILSDKTPFSVAEAYRMARTNIMYMPSEKKCKIFAVTSAYAAEGKTTMATNLALSFAQSNKKILLIDADMRKPRVKKNMGLKVNGGLSEYLAGITDKAEICKHPENGLDIIIAGKSTTASSELLETSRMSELIEELSEKYEYIIIDTPPMNLVTDASVIANLVNGYILSVRCNFSDVDGIKEAVVALQQVDANIVGFMLNGIDPKYNMYGKYRYRYKYSRYGYGYYKYGYKNYEYKEGKGNDKEKTSKPAKPDKS